MKKTYSEFLNELSEFYTIGSEVELSYYEFTENQELYEGAIADDYIMLGITSKGILTMKIIKLPVPYLSHEDVISYFN
jgi:hypothetical protein